MLLLYLVSGTGLSEGLDVHLTQYSSAKQFGIMLDFDTTFLDYIEAKSSKNLYQCLIDMLDLWLKRVDPLPSWKALFEALQALKEEIVVYVLEIKEKYQLQ